MKSRLIELLRDARKNTKGANCDLEREHLFADYLLANGVIVPPCKVGDDVYIPWHYNGTRGIAYFEVTHIIMDCKESYVKTDFATDDEGFWDLCNGGKFYFDDFGKTIFLTKKEAEKALKEGADDGC